MVLKDASSGLARKLYTLWTPTVMLAIYGLSWATALLVSRKQCRDGADINHLDDTKHSAAPEGMQRRKTGLQFRLPFNDPKYFTQGKGARMGAKAAV